jgi:hypothetical protein
VIAGLHAKEASDRYQTATEVAELLQKCLVHVQTPNTPLPEELQPPKRFSGFGRVKLGQNRGRGEFGSARDPRSWHRRPLWRKVLAIVGAAFAITMLMVLWPQTAVIESHRLTPNHAEYDSDLPGETRGTATEEHGWETDLSPAIQSLEETAADLASETRMPFADETYPGTNE